MAFYMYILLHASHFKYFTHYDLKKSYHELMACLCFFYIVFKKVIFTINLYKETTYLILV